MNRIDQNVLKETHRQLCELGPRLLGSPAEAEAIDLMADRFRALGLEVEHQEVPLSTYHRGTCRLELITPDGFAEIPAMAFIYSPETTGVGEWELLNLGSAEARRFRRLRAQIRGRAVLVADGCRHKWQRCLQAGAVAYLVAPRLKLDTFPMGVVAAPEGLRPCPKVVITPSGYDRIARDVPPGEVGRIRLEVSGRTEPVTSRNLIATLPGRSEAPEVWVGAHVDTFDFAPGGIDDTTGVAGLLALAGALQDDPPLRRTIRFLLFTGEEANKLGSAHLVRQWQPDHRRASVYVNLDIPLGGRPAHYVQAGEEAAGRMTELARELGYPELFADVLRRNSDHYPFYRQGIPCLLLRGKAQGEEDIIRYVHTPLDQADRVDQQELLEHIRLAERLIRHLAGSEASPFEPFQPQPDDPALYDDT